MKIFNVESKKHQQSLDWFRRNADLKATPISKDDLGRFGMPESIINMMQEWEVIMKSPYSDSFYSSALTTFEHKPHGSMRVANHWNFVSRRDSKVAGTDFMCF